jgi:hypothetical protein
MTLRKSSLSCSGSQRAIAFRETDLTEGALELANHEVGGDIVFGRHGTQLSPGPPAAAL